MIDKQRLPNLIFPGSDQRLQGPRPSLDQARLATLFEITL